jgi:circadian clock protein KaiC
MDTWLLVRFIETNGERNRGLYVLKSRGMPHSNQIREFILTERGIQLVEVYTGPSGVLTGTARYAQEARERAEALQRAQEIERKRRELERRRVFLEAQIAAMRAEFEREEQEVQAGVREWQHHEEELMRGRDEMARLRQSEARHEANRQQSTDGEEKWA